MEIKIENKFQMKKINSIKSFKMFYKENYENKFYRKLNCCFNYFKS